MVHAEDVKTHVHYELPKSGESIMMKIVLLKPQKEVEEPALTRNLFRTMYKAKGKYYKLIIDNGSTNNLVLTEMVDKLGLKKIVHPTPLMVS